MHEAVSTRLLADDAIWACQCVGNDTDQGSQESGFWSPLEIEGKIIVTMATHTKSPMRATVLLTVSIVATVAALWLYVSVVYEGTSDGLGYSAGKIFGTFVIALLIGFFVNKRRFSKNLFSVCLLIAVAMFCMNNAPEFNEALEAKEYKSIVAQAKTPQDIIGLSKEHPNNRFFAFVGDTMVFREESEKTVAEITAPLDAYDFGCAEKITERDRQTLVRCRDHFVKMAATIRGVKERYEPYLAQRQEKLRKFVADESQRYKFADKTVMREMENGMAIGLQNTESFSREYLNSISTLNSSYIDLFSFLVEHFDQYEYDLKIKKVMWANDELLSQYTSLYGRADKAEDAYDDLLKKMQAYESQRFDRMIK